jgi:hypothetical protein
VANEGRTSEAMAQESLSGSTSQNPDFSIQSTSLPKKSALASFISDVLDLRHTCAWRIVVSPIFLGIYCSCGRSRRAPVADSGSLRFPRLRRTHRRSASTACSALCAMCVRPSFIFAIRRQLRMSNPNVFLLFPPLAARLVAVCKAALHPRHSFALSWLGRTRSKACTRKPSPSTPK